MEERLLNKKKRALKEGKEKLVREALRDLGSYYTQYSRYNDAINVYEELAERYELTAATELGGKMKWAACQRMIGESYLSVFNYAKAFLHVNKHLAVAKELKDTMEEIKAHENLGRIYNLLGQSQSAEDEAKRNWLEAKRSLMRSLQLTVSSDLGEKMTVELMETRAKILLNLADVQEHLGDFDKALMFIAKAKKICLKKNFYEVLHICYTTEANMHGKKKDFSLALNCLEKALKLTDNIKNKFYTRNKAIKTCEVLASQAHVLCKMGDYQGAKMSLIKAWKKNTQDAEDRKNIIFDLKVVAAMCKTLALIESTSKTDHMKLKNLYETLGDGACRLKNYDGAAQFYCKSLHHAQAAGESGKTLAPIYVSLYKTYKDMGIYRTAITYCNLEYALIKDTPSEAHLTLFNIAELHYLAKSYTEFEKACHDAYESAKSANNPVFEIKVLKLLLKYLKQCPPSRKREEVEGKLRSLGLEDFDNLENTEEELIEPDTTHVGDDFDLEELRGECDLNHAIEAAKSINVTIRKNRKGETSLHRACINGNKQKVASLLNEGHPVDEVDHANWTALHGASLRGHRDIVALLIEAKANLDAVGGVKGVTPMYKAASNGHLEVVELLLDEGANPSVTTTDGKTALDALLAWRLNVTHALTKDNEASFGHLCSKMMRIIENIQNYDDVNLASTSHVETAINEPLPSTSEVSNIVRDDLIASTSQKESSMINATPPSTSNTYKAMSDNPQPSISNVNNLTTPSNNNTSNISEAILETLLPSTAEISSIFEDLKQNQANIVDEENSDDDVIFVSVTHREHIRKTSNDLAIEKHLTELLASTGLMKSVVKMEKFEDGDIRPPKKRGTKRKSDDSQTNGDNKPCGSRKTNNANESSQPLPESNGNAKQKRLYKRKISRDDLGVTENRFDGGSENVSLSRIEEVERPISNTSRTITDSLHEITNSIKLKSNPVDTNNAMGESVACTSKRSHTLVSNKMESKTVDTASKPIEEQHNLRVSTDGTDSNKCKSKPKTKKAMPPMVDGQNEELFFDDSLDRDEFPVVDVKYTKLSQSFESANDSGVNEKIDVKINKLDNPSPGNSQTASSDIHNKSDSYVKSGCQEKRTTSPNPAAYQDRGDNEENRDPSNNCKNNETMYVTAVESQFGLSDEEFDGNDDRGLSSLNNIVHSPLPTQTPPPPTLKVHFSNNELHITLSEETINRSKISWLVEEVKTRLGACPEFSLMTPDGIALSEDEPLSLVLSTPELKVCGTNFEVTEQYSSIAYETPPHDEPESPSQPSPPPLDEETTILVPLLNQGKTDMPSLDQGETAPLDQDETLTSSRRDIDEDENTILSSEQKPGTPPHMEQPQTIYNQPLTSTPGWPQPIRFPKMTREKSVVRAHNSPTFTQSDTQVEDSVTLDLEKSNNHTSSRSKVKSSRRKHDETRPENVKSSHSKETELEPKDDNSLRPRKVRNKFYVHDQTPSRSENDKPQKHSELPTSSHSNEYPQTSFHPDHNRMPQSEVDLSNLPPSRFRHDSGRKSISSQSPISDEPTQTALPTQHQKNNSIQHISRDESAQLNSGHEQDKAPKQNFLSNQAGLYKPPTHDSLLMHPSIQNRRKSSPRHNESLKSVDTRHNCDELSINTHTLSDPVQDASSLNTVSEPVQEESSQNTQSDPVIDKLSQDTTPDSDDVSSLMSQSDSVHEESSTNTSQLEPKSSLSIVIKRVRSLNTWRSEALNTSCTKSISNRTPKKEFNNSTRFKQRKPSQPYSSRCKHYRVKNLSTSQSFKCKKPHRRHTSPRTSSQNSRIRTPTLGLVPTTVFTHVQDQLDSSPRPENSQLTTPQHIQDGVIPTQPNLEGGDCTVPILESIPSTLSIVEDGVPFSPHIEESTALNQPPHVSELSTSSQTINQCNESLNESTSQLPGPSNSQLLPCSHEQSRRMSLTISTTTSYLGPVKPGPQTQTDGQYLESQIPIKMECPDEPQLDDDIMRLLGDLPTEKPLGPPLHSRIALSWQQYLSNGMRQEEKDAIMNSYLVPYNCQLLQAPTLNPEVKVLVRETLTSLDGNLMNHQKQLGSAISALGSAVNMILSNTPADSKVLTPILDACKLLCDMHHQETETRREYFLTSVSSEVKESLVNTTRGTQLFGDNLRYIKTDSNCNFNYFVSTSEPSTSVHPNLYPLQKKEANN